MLFKGERHPKLKLSLFCVRSLTIQTLKKKTVRYNYLKAHCLRNLKMVLKFKKAERFLRY